MLGGMTQMDGGNLQTPSKNDARPKQVSSDAAPLPVLSPLEKAEAILNEGRGIVFFDSTCLLCHNSVQRIYRNDSDGRFFFSSLQGEVAAAMLPAYGLADPAQSDSMVLLKDGKVSYRSDAALRIAKELDQPLKTLGYLGVAVPRPLREYGYNVIARNRKEWFGEAESCDLSEVSGIKERLI